MKTLISILTLALMSSCTISFQNVDTHGTATIEDEQTLTPETELTVPAM